MGIGAHIGSSKDELEEELSLKEEEEEGLFILIRRKGNISIYLGRRIRRRTRLEKNGIFSRKKSMCAKVVIT